MAVDDDDTSVELSMTAGLPYNRRIRVVGAASIWPTEDSFEVRSQIRSAKRPPSEFIADLTPFLSGRIEGQDVVVDLALTGAQTRALPKGGYYDIVVSDPGPTDARALSVLSGKVKLGALITGASDD